MPISSLRAVSIVYILFLLVFWCVHRHWLWVGIQYMFQEWFEGFPGSPDRKESAYNAGDPGSIPGLGRYPEEGNGNPLQNFAWRIQWMEEPDRLQSMGLQRVRQDWATSLHFTTLQNAAEAQFLVGSLSSTSVLTDATLKTSIQYSLLLSYLLS